MITKHEAAQRFAEIMLNKLENPLLFQTNGRMAIISENAFKLADAMQAEADKRDKAEAEQKSKEVREILKDANAFIEREGQHFDDVEEWQPDWSQAPDGADSWTMRPDGKCLWWKGKPLFDGCCFYDAVGICHTVGHAPSFGYAGNWQDSLRERPQ